MHECNDLRPECRQILCILYQVVDNNHQCMGIFEVCNRYCYLPFTFNLFLSFFTNPLGYFLPFSINFALSILCLLSGRKATIRFNRSCSCAIPYFSVLSKSNIVVLSIFSGDRSISASAAVATNSAPAATRTSLRTIESA